ncbi:CFEM domain containing integral membrane protein [Colletotrichum truncatum]|uniref:CFEM domain containing integral membrane protein n=1 Tax=Colletotrichum truncatum TaxID=5467 RepID=A0ACC3Z3C1_COLTU
MIRIKYLVSYAEYSFDPTWDNVDVVIWSLIEVNFAMICGSLPMLRPICSKIRKWIAPCSSMIRDKSHVESGDQTKSTKSSLSYGPGSSYPLCNSPHKQDSESGKNRSMTSQYS